MIVESDNYHNLLSFCFFLLIKVEKHRSYSLESRGSSKIRKEERERERERERV